jgi:rhodanese-related sulfurtransferase
MLLNAGYDVIEIGGGVAAWKESHLSTEPVKLAVLEGHNL